MSPSGKIELYNRANKSPQINRGHFPLVIFGGIVRPAAWPAKKQPISRSQKIQAQLSQPRTNPLVKLCSRGRERLDIRWPTTRRATCFILRALACLPGRTAFCKLAGREGEKRTNCSRGPPEGFRLTTICESQCLNEKKF